jgi:hypothetical protein
VTRISVQRERPETALATVESFEATVARGRAMAETNRKPLTLADAFVAMARAEANEGGNDPLVQDVVVTLTPHLTGTQRAVWWFGLRRALDGLQPACGITPAFDASSEDYKTALTSALEALTGAPCRMEELQLFAKTGAGATP